MSADDVDVINALLKGVVGRLDDQARRLDSLDQRFDALMKQVAEIRSVVAAMHGDYQEQKDAMVQRAANKRAVWQIAVTAGVTLLALAWQARRWLHSLLFGNR